MRARFPSISMLLLAILLGPAGCRDSAEDKFQQARQTPDMVEYQRLCGELDDQVLLGELVLRGGNWGKRRTAVDFVTDEQVLETIVAESEDFDVRAVAAQRLETLRSGEALSAEPTVRWQTIGPDGPR